MTSTLSLSKRAEGGPLLRRIEQIRLPDIQLDQIVQTTATAGSAGFSAGATSPGKVSRARAFTAEASADFGGGGATPRASFTVHHRVGSVIYGTSDFVVQNRSLLFFNNSMRNIVDAIKKSRHAFVAELAGFAEAPWKFKMKNSAAQGAGHEVNGPKFLTQQRVNELGYILNQLQRTNTHFVACVNPNQLARSGYIASNFVEAQLQMFGIPDIARVFVHGYPIRRFFRSFFLDNILAVQQPFEERSSNNMISRFQSLMRAPRGDPATAAALRNLCKDVLALLWQKISPSADADAIAAHPRRDSIVNFSERVTKERPTLDRDWIADAGSLIQFGRTKVFMKGELVERMEQAREEHERYVEAQAVKVQSFLRMVLASHAFRSRRAAIARTQAVYRAYMYRVIYQQQRAGRALLREHAQVRIAQANFQRLRWASSLITRILNAHIARKRLENIRIGLCAIHWMSRGFLFRCRLLRKLWAVRTLQRQYRRYARSQANKFAQLFAAICMQRLVRGYQLRRKRPDVVAFLRLRREERHREAVIRQGFAAFQASQTRLRFLHLQRAAKHITCVVTTRLVHQDFIHRQRAATQCQATVRRYFAQVAYSRALAQKEAEIQEHKMALVRERERLLMADYIQWIESRPVWSAQARRASLQAKPAFLSKLYDVDVVSDCSEMYGSGFVDTVRQLQQSLHEKQDSLASICSGSTHSVAVSENGQVFSWGWGDLGELGLGDCQQQSTPSAVTHFMGPEPLSHRRSHATAVDAFILASKLEAVVPTPQVVGIACGRDHSLLLTQQGQVFTWGAGYRGELGLGDFGAKRVRPTLVHSLRRRATSIAAGAHTSVALVTGGAVYMWGSAAKAVCKSATSTPEAAISANSDINKSLTIIKQTLKAKKKRGVHVDVGADQNANETGLDFAHLDAINAMDAEALRAEFRERGLSARGIKHAGGLRSRLLQSLANSAKIHRSSDSCIPILLKSLPHDGKANAVSSVKTGWHFGILLTQNNRVYTFGCEETTSSPSAGSGEQPHQWRPQPRLARQTIPGEDVDDDHAPTILNVFAGGSHAGALSSDGKLWLWGSNGHGQVGRQESYDVGAVVYEPRLVDRGSLAQGSESDESPRIVSVGLGWRHTVVLDAQNRVHTWGHCIAARASAHVFSFRGETHLGHGPGAQESLQKQQLQLSKLVAQDPEELPVIVQPAQRPLAIMCTSSPTISATLIQFRQESFDVRGGIKDPSAYTSPFSKKAAEEEMNLRVAGDIIRNSLPGGGQYSPPSSQGSSSGPRTAAGSVSGPNNDFTNEIVSHIDPGTLSSLSKEQLVAIMRVATNDHARAGYHALTPKEVPVQQLQAWQLIRFIQMYASGEFAALFPDFVVSDESVDRANIHARKLARFYAVPQLQELLTQATGVTTEDTVICLNSVPAVKVSRSLSNAEEAGTQREPLLLTATAEGDDPDFGSPKRGALARLLGDDANPAHLRTPQHYMDSAGHIDVPALDTANVLRYLGHPKQTGGSPSSTPPRRSSGPTTPSSDTSGILDDAGGESPTKYVPPYPLVRNPVIDHTMLRSQSSRRTPPRHLPEVAERAVQQAHSKLTPKQEAALAAYRFGGRNHYRPHRSDDSLGASRSKLGLDRQLVGRSSQRQQEIENMIRREVQAGMSRKKSPERQRPAFQLMGGTHSQVYFKAQRRLVKGAAKAKAALDWKTSTEQKQALRRQIEAERRELQVMQAEAAAGGRELDGAQVHAGLSSDIKSVINDVNRSVLNEVNSLMMAGEIQSSLNAAGEPVSPITRARDDE